MIGAEKVRYIKVTDNGSNINDILGHYFFAMHDNPDVAMSIADTIAGILFKQDVVTAKLIYSKPFYSFRKNTHTNAQLKFFSNDIGAPKIPLLIFEHIYDTDKFVLINQENKLIFAWEAKIDV